MISPEGSQQLKLNFAKVEAFREKPVEDQHMPAQAVGASENDEREHDDNVVMHRVDQSPMAAAKRKVTGFAKSNAAKRAEKQMTTRQRRRRIRSGASNEKGRVKRSSNKNKRLHQRSRKTCSSARIAVASSNSINVVYFTRIKKNNVSVQDVPRKDH